MLKEIIKARSERLKYNVVPKVIILSKEQIKELRNDIDEAMKVVRSSSEDDMTRILGMTIISSDHEIIRL